MGTGPATKLAVGSRLPQCCLDTVSKVGGRGITISIIVLDERLLASSLAFLNGLSQRNLARSAATKGDARGKEWLDRASVQDMLRESLHSRWRVLSTAVWRCCDKISPTTGEEWQRKNGCLSIDACFPGLEK